MKGEWHSLTVCSLRHSGVAIPSGSLVFSPAKLRTASPSVQQNPDPHVVPAMKRSTRRQFISRSGAAAAFSLALPATSRAARKISPNEKLNVAAIGIGGMGAHNVSQCSDENIVALCDLDLGLSAKTIKAHPEAKVFTDYREMLGKQKDIDAVIIATPDHSHAVIGMHCIRARQACLHSETAGALGPRGAGPGGRRTRAQGRHADGQPGALGRGRHD